MVLASILSVSQNLGYPILVLVVGIEALGVPVPGETALVLAAVAASTGRLSIVLVIVLSSVAAIIGDNIGFQIGRRGGRALLTRPGRFYEERQRAVALADPFFERHGPKAVFLGRWLAGLRIWAAWFAGASAMSWRTFMLWNALGGIGWSTSVGLGAYFGGKAAEKVITDIGLYGLILAAVLATVAGVLYWRHRRAHRAA